ncbi:APH-domain-containing protein [Polychaeton citri CBS 116435]|uniref:APH-domain-containing protein n=1 Tax=Polychaeton citri CBS 116435 TaxID=1314669 RepID=A0A9P4UKV7_9PEZI|nr:APH-domain-containing protein [Polychaeton citri CBS 116435]
MAGAIRQPIDIPSLERYINTYVPSIKTPLKVKQFGYGQSNPTYLLASPDGSKYVMRKKPPGQLLSKTAHKVDREYRILHALENTDVPVPKTYCLCEDDGVVGTPFYIMEFLDGRIFEDPAIPDVSPKDRKAMWKSAVETLAKFHRVTPASVGLSSFGKPSEFYNRQLNTFAAISAAQAKAKDKDTGVPVGPIPHYDDIVSFFREPSTQPKDRSTFVHGDYKIDNVVFHKTKPYVIGILDWEMSTIGHPLSDVANLLGPYVTAGNAKAKDVGRAHGGFLPGAIKGLPTKEECLEWYEQIAGWGYPKREVIWGDAFGIYRGSIIMQGIAARYAQRQASSAKAMEYGKAMEPFGEVAWELVEEARNQMEKAKL